MHSSEASEMHKGAGNDTLASEDDPLVVHVTTTCDDQVHENFDRQHLFRQVRIH